MAITSKKMPGYNIVHAVLATAFLVMSLKNTIFHIGFIPVYVFIYFSVPAMILLAIFTIKKNVSLLNNVDVRNGGEAVIALTGIIMTFACFHSGWNLFVVTGHFIHLVKRVFMVSFPKEQYCKKLLLKKNTGECLDWKMPDLFAWQAC